MLENILICTVLTFVTILIHTLASKIILTQFSKWNQKAQAHKKLLRLDFTVMIIIIATAIEVSIWSLIYVKIEALPNIADALYFSLVTYSTLGYGDIVITDAHRIVAAFQSAIGVIMFGWSTALLIASLQKNYIVK